jgi:PKD repeat protein
MAANPAHAFPDNGTWTVTLTVTDAGGLTSTASTTATTANVAPTATWTAPSTVAEGTSYTLKLAGTDKGTADRPALQYRFDCGRGAGWTAWSTTVKSVTCAKVPDQLATALTLRGAVLDKDGASRTYTRQLTVTNAAPVVTLKAATATTVRVGASVGVSGSFTDKGVGDALWRYTIAWGDGTTSTGTTSTQGAAKPIAGSHVYGAAGTYYVQLSVTDKDGRTGKSGRLTVSVTP